MAERVRKELRVMYPDPSACQSDPFGHPADAWANELLHEAHRAITTTRRLKVRRPNEDLRTEQEDLLLKVQSAENSLRMMSHDLAVLLPAEADVDAACDTLHSLVPHLTALRERIRRLPRARREDEVRRAAAEEMAIRCLRLLDQEGGRVAATADKDLERASISVRLLKTLGDVLGLPLDVTTWKKVVIAVKAKV